MNPVTTVTEYLDRQAMLARVKLGEVTLPGAHQGELLGDYETGGFVSNRGITIYRTHADLQRNRLVLETNLVTEITKGVLKCYPELSEKIGVANGVVNGYQFTVLSVGLEDRREIPKLFDLYHGIARLNILH